MNRYVFYLAALAVFASLYAVAQRTQPREPAGYLVVATCGTLPAPAYVAGSYQAPTIDTTGKTCVNQ
jgi:hypothetical protein